MPRVISFIVLLIIVLLVGAVFFQVMAQFMVPLFLAAVLAVIFQPLYAWMLERLPNRSRVCALLTTILILLAVLFPIGWLGWRAYVDLHTLFAVVEKTSAQPTDQSGVSSARESLSTGEDHLLASDATTDTSDQPTPAKGHRRLVEKLDEFANSLMDKVGELTGLRFTTADLKPLIERAAGMTGSVVLSGVQSVIGILIGLAIMVISLYYFLADGPGMIGELMRLSPLDTVYEHELLARFGQVSRAVVVAVLLSAAVQGSLAGIGYYFALPASAPIFLLTVLTMVTAIVPFVGAAAVWVPVCLWIFFYGERVGAGGQILETGNWVVALVLAIYSTIVVSGVDNVIKPLILHGQSKLHPLLALLSILGGVQVLGPAGILVGPMLVSFLQALLMMLRKELDTFRTEDELADAQKLADCDYNVPQNVLASRQGDNFDTQNGSKTGATATLSPVGQGISPPDAGSPVPDTSCRGEPRSARTTQG